MRVIRLYGIHSRNNCLFQENIDEYGIDENGPIPLDGLQNDSVQVPEIRGQDILSQQQFQNMTRLINPMAASECHGADIYIRAREFVYSVAT